MKVEVHCAMLHIPGGALVAGALVVGVLVAGAAVISIKGKKNWCKSYL